jgi:hypothetical protein
MKIKSLVSIVARAESAKDRQAAIRKSWSTVEAEDRRRTANDAQVLLASLITEGQARSKHMKTVLEMVAC